MGQALAQERIMTARRQRMLEDMQVRNFSPHTQCSYVQQVSQFARHFQQSPDQGEMIIIEHLVPARRVMAFPDTS